MPGPPRLDRFAAPHIEGCNWDDESQSGELLLCDPRHGISLILTSVRLACIKLLHLHVGSCMGAYDIPLRKVPMFLRSGWYQCYFGVDSFSLSTFCIFQATNNSPGHVSNHLGKVPPHLPTFGAFGLRCCMSKGSSSHVAGCVFVARPGQCKIAP